ncbi:MAG: acyl carrier protein [Acidiferrobacterales bacterium]|nr:acyl carrier protein [Acidiferrobacterales bacterium]
MSLSKDQILQHIKQVLTELFEVEQDQLIGSARLFDDLDIDSIDTIDLLIELKKILGKEIDPASFKNAQTIDDVVDVISQL